MALVAPNVVANIVANIATVIVQAELEVISDKLIFISVGHVGTLNFYICRALLAPPSDCGRPNRAPARTCKTANFYLLFSYL